MSALESRLVRIEAEQLARTLPAQSQHWRDVSWLCATVRALSADLSSAVNLIEDKIRPPRFDSLVQRRAK